jgi:hypothetical protein
MKPRELIVEEDCGRHDRSHNNQHYVQQSLADEKFDYELLDLVISARPSGVKRTSPTPRQC